MSKRDDKRLKVFGKPDAVTVSYKYAGQYYARAFTTEKRADNYAERMLARGAQKVKVDGDAI